MSGNKTILIVGGGIAGLSAGCYARMNGYESLIFEMGHRPGGVCTSWEREGFNINGCIHWLVGSGPGPAMHRVWKELGVLKDRTFIDHDRYMTFEARSGHTFSMYSDIDKLEAHLLDHAPEDQEVIHQFAEAVRTFSRYDMPLPDPRPLAQVIEGARIVFTEFPMLRIMLKWVPVSIEEWAEKLKNPDLKELFLGFWDPRMSMLMLIMTLSFAHNKTAGYPLGGSLPFSQAIAGRYKELGGKIEYQAHVDRILVKDGRAEGVLLADGREYHGDYVISAADLHYTLHHLLQGKFLHPRFQHHFDSLTLFPSLIYLSLGVNDTMKEEVPASIAGLSFPLPKPLQVGAKKVDRLNVQAYHFDPTLAPAGKTVLTIFMETEYSFWHEFALFKEEYRAEKQKLIEEVIEALSDRFPGLKEKIEMVDMSTPLTFHRYTGNYQGSYEGWLPTPVAFRTQINKTLPGLDNFYLAGHWVEPGGGIPTVALSGRSAIQRICHRDHKPFHTEALE